MGSRLRKPRLKEITTRKPRNCTRPLRAEDPAYSAMVSGPERFLSDTWPSSMRPNILACSTVMSQARTEPSTRAPTGPNRRCTTIDSGSGGGGVGSMRIRPISRPCTISAEVRSDTSLATPSRVKRTAMSRFGRALMASASAAKSAMATPSTAVTTSPSRRPASAAGPPGSTRPRRGGMTGDQNRNPMPRISAAGSVSTRRASASSTRSSTSRSPPFGARTVKRATPSSLIASMRPNSTSPCEETSRPPRRRISSSARRPACATMESGAMRPTTGRTSGEPIAQSIPHSTRMANAKLAAGPASSTRMRCHGGRRVKERARSASGTGPSRSSSSLT